MKNKLAAEKKKIDYKLKQFLDKRTSRMHMVSPAGREVFEHIREFTLRGGKRIRPILVVEAYKACGGKSRAIYEAAIAVELMESFLLVHDDIMDQDELRRGYLTMHKAFEAKAKKCRRKDCSRYGESMAMIAGDILSILGTEALINSQFSIENKLKAIDRFNRAVINTCIGQAIDVKGGQTKKDTEKLYELKTAIYTFEAPLHIGALLAGAHKDKLKNLSAYALPLGKAFQIKDDILGLFGTRQRIGKPVGSDIREGKKTLLIHETMDLCSASDKKFIEKCLGTDVAASDIQRIQDIIRKSGALVQMEQKAKEYAALARASLKIKSRFLQWLAKYVVEREY